jgi:predicted acylesterase/phospholipase RssA/CRP-like cAMP-binding protein
MTSLQADASRTALADFLLSTDLFEDLGGLGGLDLGSELELVTLCRGETLMRQGEPGDCLYALLNGRLRVFVQSAEGQEEVVGEVGRGELVGEMALLSDEPRSATVRAVRDSKLIRLSKSGVEKLVERNPKAMLRATRLIASRLRKTLTSRRPPSDIRTVALVAADPSLSLDDFTERLRAALEAYGRTCVFTSRRVEELTGGCTPDQDRMLGWLAEQERGHRYLIYRADPEPTAWSRLCLHQADRVLVVARASGEPALGALEAEMALPAAGATEAYQELVLLHDEQDERARDTERWLGPRTLHAHHHVRVGRTADYQRLARRLTGRAIGLVLGGGGARGLAHVGILGALTEAGIPVDLIGGTSMGSVIAGLYAMGLDYQTLRHEAAVSFAKAGRLRDFTLPLVSIMRGHGIERLIRRQFGDARIEDLWLDYYCVSANLSRADVVIHRRGSLWRAIRASVSLPGVLPPVVQENHELLVDGGLLNNLPVDVMRVQCEAGQVLAVDVGCEVDVVAHEAFPGALSGWRLLADRCRPFRRRPQVPGILSILLRSSELGGVYSTRSRLGHGYVDLYLRPPIESFGILEFEAYQEIMDLGYRYGLEKVEAWLSAERATANEPVPQRDTAHA